MDEWKGPWKCEKCGAETCKDWAGEIEYANGNLYHFTFRIKGKGAMPLMCDGEMKPYDRRAERTYSAEEVRQAFEDGADWRRATWGHAMDAADEALRRYPEKPREVSRDHI